jgi:hydrogenase maturation protease
VIRVIGIGSPFGDDRAAWEVIDELGRRLPPAIDLVRLNQPGASLINWFDAVDRLVLVDVLPCESPCPPFVRLVADDLAPTPGPLSSHGQQLRETLALAARLDCLPAQTEIYAVTAPSPNLDELCDRTRDAAHALAVHLAGMLGAARPSLTEPTEPAAPCD